MAWKAYLQDITVGAAAIGVLVRFEDATTGRVETRTYTARPGQTFAEMKRPILEDGQKLNEADKHRVSLGVLKTKLAAMIGDEIT